ncbi:hypothetical protein FKO01_07165 [Mesorhizobium sp. B2-3-3]|nr:hypothetical protein FKO01_07165 [Mesorhizobium sp. B2-3-3]
MTDPRLQALKGALARLRDEQQPPEHLVQAAIALHDRAPAADIFHLRAAASESLREGLACTSQSGLLTLEIFVARGSGEPPTRGQVLLSIHSDHRAAFEARTALIFVRTDDGERVLADSVIRNGEMLADIDLAGLDLARRDAINVVFGPVARK